MYCFILIANSFEFTSLRNRNR